MYLMQLEHISYHIHSHTLMVYERRRFMHKKLKTGVLAALAVASMAGSVISFAAENKTTVYESSMENSYIKLSVEQDPSQAGEFLRYRLDTSGGQVSNSKDDKQKLTYGNFFSGITVISINGVDYTYGRGETVGEPSFSAGDKCHTSQQKFGDTVIEQKLQFTEGFTKGYDDMLKITYTVKSAPENADIGVNVLIDPMISNDDKAELSVADVKIKNETVFNENIPKEWKVKKADSDDVTAYGKTDENGPDSMIFANWDRLYNELPGFQPDTNASIEDCATDFRWNAAKASAGKVYTAYYGIRNYASSGTNDVSVSPDTGVRFPASAAVLFVLSAASSAALIITRRKEKKDAE